MQTIEQLQQRVSELELEIEQGMRREDEANFFAGLVVDRLIAETGDLDVGVKIHAELGKKIADGSVILGLY